MEQSGQLARPIILPSKEKFDKMIILKMGHLEVGGSNPPPAINCF